MAWSATLDLLSSISTSFFLFLFVPNIGLFLCSSILKSKERDFSPIYVWLHVLHRILYTQSVISLSATLPLGCARIFLKVTCGLITVETLFRLNNTSVFPTPPVRNNHHTLGFSVYSLSFSSVLCLWSLIFHFLETPYWIYPHCFSACSIWAISFFLSTFSVSTLLQRSRSVWITPNFLCSGW